MNVFAPGSALATLLGLGLVAGCSPAGTSGDSPSGYSPDRERVARFASSALIGKVRNGYPVPQWIGGEDRFWLRVESERGHQYVIVDAATGRQSPAFDHPVLARALSAAGGSPLHPDSLPIQGIQFLPDAVAVQLGDRTWRCFLTRVRCDSTGAIYSAAEVPSPDRRVVAFIRDHNVWLRDQSGRERQLTTEGVEYFGYGNAGIFDAARVARRRTGAPRGITGLVWSPDGRYLASFRSDRRAFPLRPHFTEHLPPDGAQPTVYQDRQPVAGDNIVPGSKVELIDTETGRIVVADVPSERLQDFAPIHFSAGALWWNLAGGELFFDGATRDARTYLLFAVDIRTGRSRVVIEETEQHYYDFNPDDYAVPNFFVTSDGAQAIWYSQRTGYGHLYRYDARTGRLTNPITSGDWVVTDLLRVDEATRMVYFVGVGREPGRNPYYRHLYRVSLDGGEPTLLTPEDADHGFAAPPALSPAGLGGPGSRISPSGKFFADTYSTLEKPPELVVRTASGDSVATVLRADPAALLATGWRPPTRFVVKAADGETDLYGALFTPLEMDSSLRHAVVELTYPGPQGSYGPHGFMAGIAGSLTVNQQMTAELGFVGVALDGRGTSRRGRAFRYAFAGTEDVFGSADHRAAIENLAKQHRFVDAERVGIVGGSFGGYGTVRAMLLHPGFFDVTVSHVGPHDFRRMGPGLTVERFFGIPTQPGSPDDFYATISNTRLANRLEGKLLLVYGEIDENVPFLNMITFLDALIKADEDFDLVVLPNAPHGTMGHPYAVRRQLDYLVRHLGGPRRD
jgi:dipeptidyl aminopeptidase/acylaminoacyl peptidase